MKNCPNCKSEIEDDWDLCWNCNYSFIDGKVLTKVSNEIDCLRCHTPLAFAGNYKFHEGSKIGFWGDLFELFLDRAEFDLYSCPKCGKVEFFIPKKGNEIHIKTDSNN
jgi:Zn finger protein HypA/HybF involved in hydrogenase expression